ncbi:MAG: hypothetical protein SFU86_01320 [Pirellulaceae bacterium]|nr:hypothetical protein [Pirellulaceae bacterium]
MQFARLLTASLLCVAGFSHAADELERRATWNLPTTAEVKARLDDFLAGKKLDETAQLKIAALWPDDAAAIEPAELLDRVAASLAVVEPRAAAIVTHCQQAAATLPPPKFALLDDTSVPDFVRHNLRLLYGRWLAQHELVDESLEYLKDIDPATAADPVSLLFYRAVAHHRLLEKDACLKSVGQLLENETQLPKRYVTLAKLMEADIKPLKVDSLDEIARLMDDIRRRLDLARAGKVVRDEEEKVIAKLEKMIEEMEEQAKKQQQQQSGSGNAQQPSQPMQDSQAAQLKGPGEVDPKSLGKKDGWGNLPPKERQEVMQRIGRELPAHFRETIEEYFKRLAQDGVK